MRGIEVENSFFFILTILAHDHDKDKNMKTGKNPQHFLHSVDVASHIPAVVGRICLVSSLLLSNRYISTRRYLFLSTGEVQTCCILNISLS